MKIAVAAHSPEGEIVGIGSIGVGDEEIISRTEVTMRDPAEPLQPAWKVTVQFDPPMTTATRVPLTTRQKIMDAVRECASEIESEES